MDNNKEIYIPQIDGKDLWLSNYGYENAPGYTLLDRNGNINTKRYKASFDYSLDLIKLREVYYKTYRNSRFSYIERRFNEEKEYCNRIVNVTFEYSIKEFNRTGNDIYLKCGARTEDVVWDDCIGRDASGELVGVKVHTRIENVAEDLSKYFVVKEVETKDGERFSQYQAKSNIKCLHTVDEIRTKLYTDGFTCNGIHYVRWKRSAGSARVGKCLFIDEKMYNRMHHWEMCGLKVGKGDKVDLAALQSYISLVSSSIIGIVNIRPENILVIDTFNSTFEDDVVNVFDEDGKLQAREERMTIENNIWDGQSLIDPSLMGEYKDKGMILLRNRFFKSCAFNCNIQQWFMDHAITDVSQLNGFTLATDIKDVKLITTADSIKYVKFGSLEQWFDLLEPEFGVVKYEKPTHYMDGALVQTHYQLLNSIQLSKEEMREFLQPTFDFMTLLKTNPAVLRWWIKYRLEEEIETTQVNTKTDVIYKMMSVNSDFYKTKLYDDFKRDFLKSFTKNLKCGHVYVNGNYSTLCGNPVEMLLQAIGQFTGEGIMERNTVYSTRFDWDRELLGSRSPHITASNVLLTINRKNDLIDKYMNPTQEIVYVNSINENIMQRLAGCDYDSDSLLLTDNEILIRAAKRTDDMFHVAVYNVSSAKKPRRWTEGDMSDLDIKTSKNLIGEIINLSQELNSLIWHHLTNGGTYEDIKDIYLDVCKLSIASNCEIDKAKKEFIIDTGVELRQLRAKYKVLSKEDKAVKPHFFAHIAKQKGYYNPDRKEYRKFKTSMDYLQECVNSYNASRKGKVDKNNFLPFSDVVNRRRFRYEYVNDKTVYEVLTGAEELHNNIIRIMSDSTLSSEEQRARVRERKQEYTEKIGEWDFNTHTMIALLQAIEKEENKQYQRLLFYSLFGYPNTSFYRVIKESAEKLPEIQECDTGILTIYGKHFC